MKPERWQQLDQLFHSALEHSPSERAAFLDAACGDDEALHEQVDVLLAAHEEAGSFIERPALEVEALSVADDQNELTPGQTIGHYKILSPLGRGGMGEVYLAKDTMLGRKVALKLLPADFTRDIDRVRRFQQEARAASALNHPNIVTIHEIGQAEKRHFIATEFIDGETLRQHMSRVQSHITEDNSSKSGMPLPLHEALNIVTQTADALAVAHEAGIVHRDIKPENIMVRRRDGYIKVLDFGLAKLIHDVGVAVDTETVTKAQVKTSPGLLIGTVTYMSPEQARGEKVDVRTDLWSLGVVLYELIAGCPPFERPTPSEVIALILERDPPPLTHYVRDIPSELERIIGKALTKDRKQRYQTAKDLLVDLRHLQQQLGVDAEIDRSASHELTQRGAALTSQQLTTNTTSSAEYLVGAIKSHKLGAIITLAVVVLATFMAFWLTRQPQVLGPPVLTQLTTDTGLTTDPALSPDGKMLAYASDRSGKDNLDIWVRQIGGGEPIRLTLDPADEREPTFSPDGTMIAFRSEREGGGLYVVSALGGSPPRKIAPEGRRPRYSPDGSHIAYWSGVIGPGAGFSTHGFCRIFVVASAGGTPRQVRSDFVASAYPEWAPDGKALLFLGNRDEKLPVEENIDWWVTPLDEGLPIATGAFRETRKIGLTGPLLVYPWALIASVWETQSDSLIFSARSGDNNNLWRIGISSRTWKVTGLPQRLTFNTTIEEGPSVASVGDGVVKIAFASLGENTDIWSLPLDANRGKVTGEQRQLTLDSAADFHPSLSPDGRKMVWVSSRSGSQQIWIKDLETEQEAVLTASPMDKYHPHFSPDGMKVSFAAHQDRKWDIYLVPSTGGVAEMICEDCGQATGWSPDGKYLIGNSRDGRLFLVDVSSRRWIVLLALSGRWFAGGHFSPDGRWITFLESGFPWRERIAPFQGESMAPESTWFSVLAELRAWSPDGTMVYGDSENDGFNCIWAQRLDRITKRPTGPPIPIYHAHGARLTVFSSSSISVVRDRMVFTLVGRTGNIWMAQWKGGW